MYANLLLPVAYEPETDPSAQITTALALADAGALVTLLHVMDPLPPYAISFMTPEYRKDLVAAITADLDAKAAALPNRRIAVVEGHAGREILDWARTHGSDCIVLASHRPGMADVLLGSTATYIVQRARCAVHILR